VKRAWGRREQDHVGREGHVAGVGLAVVLALVLGASSVALAALPGDPFKLDQSNRVDRLTTLVSTLDGKSADKIGVNGWRVGRGGARGGNEAGRW
jgi:hypothetical protein